MTPAARIVVSVATAAGADPAELAGAINKEGARLLQPFRFRDGEWGLTPSPAGAVYEQGGTIIVPSNARAGEYHLAMAVSQPYMEPADPVTREVKARPEPTKRP